MALVLALGLCEGNRIIILVYLNMRGAQVKSRRYSQEANARSKYCVILLLHAKTPREDLGIIRSKVSGIRNGPL